MKIVLVGDSTVATEGGWGPGFCAVMTKNVTCVDLALNGRSTKSFRDEGAWKKALAEKGDYYLIQFGHNDQKPRCGAAYRCRRRRYAEQSEAVCGGRASDWRGAGAGVVAGRRTFMDGKVKEDLKEYANAARRVAAEEGITCIDLIRCRRGC